MKDQVFRNRISKLDGADKFGAEFVRLYEERCRLIPKIIDKALIINQHNGPKFCRFSVNVVNGFELSVYERVEGKLNVEDKWVGKSPAKHSVPLSWIPIIPEPAGGCLMEWDIDRAKLENQELASWLARLTNLLTQVRATPASVSQPANP